MNFKRTASLYMFIFLGIMVVATYVALGRKSGNTKIDMGKIHLLRTQKSQEVSER
jgi:regulatory protein YycI of two-component signal transduction system YycFG